ARCADPARTARRGSRHRGGRPAQAPPRDRARVGLPFRRAAPAAIIHCMTSAEEIAALRGRTPIFSGLSERDLCQLAEVTVPRAYLAGEAIFREGDSGDTCYVVRSGRVRVTRRHSDGRVLTLAELGPGQMFGELAMFDGETRSASVETI